MSKDHLPAQVDPFRFAENAAKLQGLLHLENMPRLSSSVLADEGIKVNMDFGIDHQGTKFLRGKVDAQLILQCQRCMESFSCKLDSKFNYGLINTEKSAAALPSEYEPLLIKDDILNLPEIVEEELIINLPIVPMHDPRQCKVKLPIVMVDDPQTVEVEKENPFKIIEFLKVKSEQEI